MRSFAARFPLLWHVTDRAALPGIARHGLLSAAALCRLHGAALPDGNRRAWHAVAPGAALRWQGMSDAAMATRLQPGLSPASWRLFINGQAFLFAQERDARRLRAREAARDQVALVFRTDTLLPFAPRACRFNNGFADRAPPARRRLRGPDDYVPAEAWRGPAPREVVIADGIPPGIPFEVATLAP